MTGRRLPDPNGWFVFGLCLALVLGAAYINMWMPLR